MVFKTNLLLQRSLSILSPLISLSISPNLALSHTHTQFIRSPSLSLTLTLPHSPLSLSISHFHSLSPSLSLTLTHPLLSLSLSHYLLSLFYTLSFISISQWLLILPKGFFFFPPNFYLNFTFFSLLCFFGVGFGFEVGYGVSSGVWGRIWGVPILGEVMAIFLYFYFYFIFCYLTMFVVSQGIVKTLEAEVEEVRIRMPSDHIPGHYHYNILVLGFYYSILLISMYNFNIVYIM